MSANRLHTFRIRAFAVVLAACAFLPGSVWSASGDPLVRAIQTDLRKLGYDIPVIDGLYGPVTAKVIETFQEDRNLPVTGKATPELRTRLDRLVFQRSRRAQRLWDQARVYLQALGFAPGSGGFETQRARVALRKFAQSYWLDAKPGFTPTLYDLIRRRVRNDPGAHAWLCNKHMTDGAYSLAVSWCKKAAGRGDVTAQYHMGWMAYYGRGRAQSDAAAFAWFRRAAKGGDRRAQVLLGLMYRRGQGTAVNVAEAMRWYERATAGKEDQ